MSSFEGKFVKDTFDGIMHLDGELKSDLKYIYDGVGNKSAISIGTDGNGAKIHGILTIGNIEYPDSGGDVGDIMYKKTSTSVDFKSTLSEENLPTLSPNPKGTYTSIKSIEVNKNGLVTEVSEFSGTLTVTSTTYYETASKISSNFVIGDSWSQITLPSNIPDSAKTVLMFIKPGVSVVGDRADIFIEASPDNGASSYPISWTHADGGDDDSDPFGSTSQFFTRISFSGNKAQVYFKKTSNQTITVEGNWDVYVLGYQE